MWVAFWGSRSLVQSRNGTRRSRGTNVRWCVVRTEPQWSPVFPCCPQNPLMFKSTRAIHQKTGSQTSSTAMCHSFTLPKLKSNCWRMAKRWTTYRCQICPSARTGLSISWLTLNSHPLRLIHSPAELNTSLWRSPRPSPGIEICSQASWSSEDSFGPV